MNEALCLGCGSCIASCPIEAIDLNYYTNDQMYAHIEASLSNKKEGEKRILIFADDNTVYRLADACGVRKMKYSTDSRIFRVPSGSRITSKLIRFALSMGADAVMIGDSPAKSSRFDWANNVTRDNIKHVHKTLSDLQIETDRIIFKEYNAGALTQFINDVDDLAEYLGTIVPISQEKKDRLFTAVRGE